MDVAVVVPWLPGDDHREAAWRHIRTRYDNLGLRTFTGSCPPGPWVKGAAVQDAVDQTDADVLVVADADVWCERLLDCLPLIEHRPVVIPHGNVHRLTQPETARFISGATGRFATSEVHRGQAGGGIVILRREIWDRVPLDPRFQGWGQEDSSWSFALSCLTGKIARFSHPLIHLWHPPQPRLNRATGSTEGRELEARYFDARRDPVRMSALVDEARTALRGTPWRSSPPTISNSASAVT